MPLASIAALVMTLAGPSSYSFTASVHGAGPTILFIPDVPCGANAWDKFVEHYRGYYKCIALTLPGVAGVPRIHPPVLRTVRDQIIRFIRDNHLRKPVLVGNGLGGTLAMWVAAQAPDLVDKVFTMDAEPALVQPTMNDQYNDSSDPKEFDLPIPSAWQRKQTAKARKIYSGNFAKAIAADFKGDDGPTVPRSSPVWRAALRSDPRALGQYEYEACFLDLRPEVPRIRAHVLNFYGYQTNAMAPEDFVRSWFDHYVHMIPNHRVVVYRAGFDALRHYPSDVALDALDEFLKK